MPRFTPPLGHEPTWEARTAGCGAGFSRRAGHPGPAASQTAGFLPAGPVRGLSFAPSGPSWPGGLRGGRRPAGRAGCSATGQRRCEPHRPTGAPRRGEPVPVSRRGWRAEGLEARERASSSEPRQDAEANARRNGTGFPRASQAVASTRRTQRDNATKPCAEELGAGCDWSWSFAPSGPSWPGGLRGGRRPAGRAGAGRTGLLGPHRPTGTHRATAADCRAVRKASASFRQATERPRGPRDRPPRPARR